MICLHLSHAILKPDDSEEIELDDDAEEDEEEIMPKKTRAALPSASTPANGISSAYIDYNIFIIFLCPLP